MSDNVVVHVFEKKIPAGLDFSKEWFEKVDYFITYLWDSMDEFVHSESGNRMLCDAAGYIEELRKIKSTLLKGEE